MTRAKKFHGIPQPWPRDVLTRGMPESLISAAEQTEMRDQGVARTLTELDRFVMAASGDGNNSSPRRAP